VSAPRLVFVPKHAEIRETADGIFVSCDGETHRFSRGSILFSDIQDANTWSEDIG